MLCPHCHKNISEALIAQHFAKLGGAAKSVAKAEAARRNGRLGGRPKKKTITPAPAVV